MVNGAVFKNSFLYVIASFLPTLVGLFMLPIYTKYLTPTDYGVVALVLTLQSFLPIVLSLQIPASIGRFYFDYSHNREYLKKYISTIFIVVSLLSLISFSIIILNLTNIISFLFPSMSKYHDIFFMGIITSVFLMFNSICVNLIKVQQKAKLFMLTSLAIFFVSLLINMLEIIVFKRGAYGVIESGLISSFISFATFFILVKNFFSFKFDLKLLIEPLKYSLPLIPYSLSGLIFMYSDRFILERYVTVSSIGLYMFSDKIASIFKMLVNESNTSFSPYFNQQAKISKKVAIKDNREIALLFTYVLSMLIVFISIFSVEIVRLVFNERYYEAWLMFPLLSSAYIFRALYCFSIRGVNFEKKTGRVAIITIIAGVINIILNLIFIPIYGVMAAVISTIISFFITFFLATIFSRKIFDMKLNIKYLSIILVYVFLSIATSIYLNNNFLNRIDFYYLYKVIILLLGLLLGVKLKVLNVKAIKGIFWKRI